MNERTVSYLSEAIVLTDTAVQSYGQYAAPTNPMGEFPSPEVLDYHLMSYKQIFDSLKLATQNVYTEDEEAQKKIGSLMLKLDGLQYQVDEVPPAYPHVYQFFLSVVAPTVVQIIQFCKENSTKLPRAKALI